MNARAALVNRVVLALLGLLLLAAGGLGLALSVEAFGASRSTYPVLPAEVRTFPDGRPWFWGAVAGILVVVAALAFLWLLKQLRTDRATRLDRTTDAREGFTTLHAGALTQAVEDEAMGVSGVTNASARLQSRRGPSLSLRVDIADSADIDRLRDRLEDDVVGHLREAVDDPEFPVHIELRPGSSAGRERPVA